MATPHTGAKPVAALHLICYFRCAGIMQKVEETFIKEYAYEQAGYAQNRVKAQVLVSVLTATIHSKA